MLAQRLQRQPRVAAEVLIRGEASYERVTRSLEYELRDEGRP